MTTTRTALALTLALMALVGGCGWKDDHGLGDAPVDQQEDRTVKVWPNGDRYPNVAAFCIGKTGVYTNTRNSDPVDVISNDPNCAEGGVLRN